VRRLRIYNPAFYCEVTIRAQNGDFLFNPNDIELRERICGLFAEGVDKTGVAIFIFHFMSNHYHGLYGFASPAQMTAFLAYLHGNLARLANESEGRIGTFWRRAKVCMVTRDAATVATRFKYIMGQAVKANICLHPGQFPGASAVDALLYGTKLIGRKVNQTQRSRDSLRLVDGAKEDSEYETMVEVPLAVPHCWADLSEDELRKLYQGFAEELARPNAGQVEERLSKRAAKRKPRKPERVAGPEPEPTQTHELAEPTPEPLPDGAPQYHGNCLTLEITDDQQTFPTQDQPPAELVPKPEALPEALPEPTPEPSPEAAADRKFQPQSDAELTPPAKVVVPERKGEDGGLYRHGKLKPKAYEGVKKRGKFPMLLSVNPRLVEEFEESYKLAVQEYYAAKRSWRSKSKLRDGSLHAAAITLPAWMLLGTLPLSLRD
jgi:hypothetical protein